MTCRVVSSAWCCTGAVLAMSATATGECGNAIHTTLHCHTRSVMPCTVCASGIWIRANIGHASLTALGDYADGGELLVEDRIETVNTAAPPPPPAPGLAPSCISKTL
jgi:hypothetical protein